MFPANLFLLLFMIQFFTCHEPKTVGDKCIPDGEKIENGIVKNLKDCSSAVELERNGKNQTGYGFIKQEPLVCCLNETEGTTPKSTTISPDVKVEQPSTEGTRGTCDPIPELLTSTKSGRKAWDKCIEYQQKLVFPCEYGVTGDLLRFLKCPYISDHLNVGGTHAQPYEFPHSALLGYGDESDIKYKCAATLISDKFLVTNAVCVVQEDSAKFVLLGATSKCQFQESHHIHKISKVIVHPDFRKGIFYNDIALVELEKPLKLSHQTIPACLYGGDEYVDADDTEALYATWFLDRPSRYGRMEHLEKVTLQKFPQLNCSEYYGSHNVTLHEESQICYGDDTINSSCRGLSGDPVLITIKKLNCMYIAVGLTSFGPNACKKNIPTVFTRISKYVPWIEQNVWP